MTRTQLCSALNKRLCYHLALPCLFFQGVPAQSRRAVLTHASLIPKHTPTSRGRRVIVVGGTSLLSTQMQRARGARGLELRDVLPGRPHAHRVLSWGGPHQCSTLAPSAA